MSELFWQIHSKSGSVYGHIVAKISVTTSFLLKVMLRALSLSYCCILKNISRGMSKQNLFYSWSLLLNWADSCLHKEKYLKYWLRFSQVPFFAWKKSKTSSINSSQFLGCPILIPDLADASTSSAPANCRQGFLPSAVTHQFCPVCAGHSAGYLPACWAFPAVAADLHLAAATKLCPICTFQMTQRGKNWHCGFRLGLVRTIAKPGISVHWQHWWQSFIPQGSAATLGADLNYFLLIPKVN